MATNQFLARNRHQNQWCGRVIIPQRLRYCFSGRRELRRSLKTSDKTRANSFPRNFGYNAKQDLSSYRRYPIPRHPLAIRMDF